MTTTINHPGFTPAAFDRAFHKAMMCELQIQWTGRPGTVAISSNTDDEVVYVVTERTCTCQGSLRTGRCYHRAYYLGWTQVLKGVEVGSARSEDGGEVA